MPALNIVPPMFVYGGDGKRVKSIINNVTTYFVGNYYEVSGSIVKKYYYAGSQRVAMRENGILSYILSDHLGSTSVIANGSGIYQSEQRYKAWGEIRYTSGTLPTRYQYTGQYSYTPEFGLYFYNSRWYDPALGRFAQADSIVPEGVQGWDRYAYVNNNPMRYVDPSGHDVGCAGYDAELCFGGNTTIAGDTRLIEGIVRERTRFGCDPNPEVTRAIIYQRLKLHHPKLTLYYYRASLIPEPVIKSASKSSPSSIIDIDFVVEWAQVDKIQAIIDFLGIVGDIAFIVIPEGPGQFAEGVITAVECGDALKAISDAFGGDFSNLSILMIVQYFESNPLVVARVGRLIPLVGSIGSGYSLFKNFNGNFNVVVKFK